MTPYSGLDIQMSMSSQMSTNSNINVWYYGVIPSFLLYDINNIYTIYTVFTINAMHNIYTVLERFCVCKGVFILSTTSKPKISGLFSLIASCFYEFQLFTLQGIWLQ